MRSCLGLPQRSFSGFRTQEVLLSWMVCGRRRIPGREGARASLPAATARDRGEEDQNSQPVPVLEAGGDHKCDCSCIYLRLLIHKTRVMIPVLARAGFLSNGAKGEVGAVVPKTFASLPSDPEVPPQGSDILPAVV